MGAPMPASIRAALGVKHHPARGVDCPVCHAAAGFPCETRASGRRMPRPHPGRISAWVRSIAVCPACQVVPGVPCHESGRPLHDGAVHPQRQVEAERNAA